MLRKILFLFIFCLAIIQYASGSSGKKLDTAYYKNDCLKKYEGSWVYKDDSTRIVISLKLKIKQYINEINAYTDQIYGGYIYESKGKIIENTINQLMYDSIKNQIPLTYFDCNENGQISIHFMRAKDNSILKLFGFGKLNAHNEIDISISYHHNYDMDDSMIKYWQKNQFPAKMILKRDL